MTVRRHRRYSTEFKIQLVQAEPVNDNGTLYGIN